MGNKINNNEKNIAISKEVPEEYWLLILYSFIQDIPAKEWDNFSYDLKYINRFNSSHKIVKEMIENSHDRTVIIESGQKLYRARIYYKDPLREFLSDVFKNDDNVDKISAKSNSIFDSFFNMQLAAVFLAIQNNTPKSKEIVEIYKKWKRKKFKGYNANESGKPPIGSAPPGRINPDKISYLYLTEDPQTAIYEVRPIIGQNVSIATFRTLDKIKLYDLTLEMDAQIEDPKNRDLGLFHEIQKRFSITNTGSSFEYLPTQYLGELIKQQGFDGLRFNSSINQGGINIVLFDDKKCKGISSDIIRVKSINLELEQPDIYEFEKFVLNKEENR